MDVCPVDCIHPRKDEAARLTQENHDLRQELNGLRHSARALSALYYFSQQITPQVDVLQLLGNILDSALTGLSANDGSLMLLDEETGEHIAELFDRVHAQGTAVLMVTHNPMLAARASRRLAMKSGRLVE